MVRNLWPRSKLLLQGSSGGRPNALAAMQAHANRWAEAWLATYWVVTALILIFGPGANADTIKLAVTQMVAAGGLYVLSSWVDRHPAFIWLFWAQWLPSFLWTYKNIDVVQKVLKRPLFESTVVGWEKMIWGDFSPAMQWCKLWPSLYFSEVLHVCYLTYYLMMPILIARLLYRQREDLARLAGTAAVVSLVTCYAVADVFPVQGPRPLYPPLPADLHGPVWTFCHSLLKQGAAGAAAFPSGHTALAMVTAFVGWRWDRKLLPLYGLWAVGVAAATVYGRFHYSVDVLGGVFVAGLAAGAMIYCDPGDEDENPD